MNADDFDLIPAPDDGERVGCIVQGNTWIKLGVPPQHAKLLKRAAKRLLKPAKRNQGEAAWRLIMCALAHVDELEAMISRDLHAVGGSEEFWDLECHWAKLARQRLAHEEAVDALLETPNLRDVPRN